MANSLTTWQQDTKNLCVQAHISLTSRRLEVYTVLRKVGIPVSAYELTYMVNLEFARNLNPVSVYRMLEFLEKKHLVRKLKSTGKYLAISPLSSDANSLIAQYLICQECGDVTALPVDAAILLELKARINLYGYEINNLEMELDCVCKTCCSESDKKTS